MRFSLPRFALKHPIMITMLTVSLVGLGVISWMRMPLTFLPDMDYPFITCYIPYPGATPEQVEKEISIPAEGEFRTIPQINRISTTSDSGGCRIGMRFESTANMSAASAEIRDRIERLKLVLPQEVEHIGIYRHSSSSMPIMVFGLFRAGENRDTSHLIRTIVQPRLARIDGVAEVQVHTSEREDEVLIEFDQDRLRTHNVSLYSVISTLESMNLNFSVGQLTEGGAEHYVRVADEFSRPEDIADIIVGPNALRLKDVANVSFRPRDRDGRYDIDEKGGAFVIISKESEANTVDVCEAVAKELDSLNEDPALSGFDRIVFFDQSEMILSALDALVDAGKMGAILAIIVLYLFLFRLAPTLVVALSMPISLISAFVFMYFSGLTLNIITMMSLIVAVGMLVDCSIVVLENIYRYYQLGLDSAEAACRGAEEVGVAITAATLTTAVVFLPVVYMEGGQMSVFMKQFAFPMIIALLGSLFSALTLIPLVLSRMKKPQHNLYAVHVSGERKRIWNSHPLNAVIAVYARVLRLALEKRAQTAVLFIGVIVLTILVPFRNVGVQQMPPLDRREVDIEIEFDQTLTEDMAENIFRNIKDVLNLQRDELGVRNIFTMSNSSGGRIELYLYTEDQIKNDPALADRYTFDDIADPDAGLQKLYSTQDVIDILTARLPKRIPGCEISMSVPGGGQEGASAKSLTLRLRGDDSRELDSYAQRFKTLVANLPDIQDVTIDAKNVHQEVQLQIDQPRAQAAGISATLIARTVDMALRGTRLTNLKQAGREFPVWAQFREEDRKNKDNLDNMAALGETGELVPLNQLVTYSKADSPTAIERIDGKNVITINVKTDAKDLGKVQQNLRRLSDNFQLPLGYSIDFGDELREVMENAANFTATLLLAFILVYIVMSALFESVFLPVSILTTIPLAFIGVYWTLYITDTPLDTVGFIGCILMVGVIVNNGIVLVDYTNLLRKRGLKLFDACVEAARSRLRPILMTTLTTVLGLVPMAFVPGEGSEMVQPIGQTILGGLSFGTLMTLFLMPVLYYGFNRYREKRDAKRALRLIAREEFERDALTIGGEQ